MNDVPIYPQGEHVLIKLDDDDNTKAGTVVAIGPGVPKSLVSNGQKINQARNSRGFRLGDYVKIDTGRILWQETVDMPVGDIANYEPGDDEDDILSDKLPTKYALIHMNSVIGVINKNNKIDK